MAKPRKTDYPVSKVVATVKAVKGNCSWGHEVGDTFEISCHDTAGLCGFFYHDIFAHLTMLEIDGGFPVQWGDPDTVTLECPDLMNIVTLELKRVKKKK